LENGNGARARFLTTTPQPYYSLVTTLST